MLAFPGLFKGALEARIPQFEHKHLIAVAQALADYVKTPSKDEIIPSALDKGVAQVVTSSKKCIKREIRLLR